MENDTKVTRIKEKASTTPIVIAISGPSGAGKDYLTQKAIKHFTSIGIPTFNIQMTTERPHRGAAETKICISPQEYDKLETENQFIGNHVNQVRYGYRISDVQKTLIEARNKKGIIILELNPSKQKSFPQELLSKLGINLTAWIGVKTTEEQTIANMKERGESDATIRARVAIIREFFDAIAENSDITICDNGPENRSNAANDFINIIEKAILE